MKDSTPQRYVLTRHNTMRYSIMNKIRFLLQICPMGGVICILWGAETNVSCYKNITREEKEMRSYFTKTISALILVIALAVGMTASLGDKAQAATYISITYAAGDDAKINGGAIYIDLVKTGKATSITTVKPTRSGCNFLGWTKNRNSGQIDFKAGDKVTFTKATTLWPVWNANIAYAAGDGKFPNGSPVMNVSVTLGKTTKVNGSTPARSVYEFLGWSTVKNSGIVQYKPGDSITYTKPMTLWPVWDTKCTLIYLNSNQKGNTEFQLDTPIFNQSLLNYISKHVSKVSEVPSKGFSDAYQFVDTWNDMPNDQAVVIINCHGNPFKFPFYGFDRFDLTNKLVSKNIKVIILIACNCGHLEHYNRGCASTAQPDENLAEAFAKRFKCVVYASDGNVMTETLESGLGSRYNPEDMWEYYNAPNSKRTVNVGWVVYDGRNYKGVYDPRDKNKEHLEHQELGIRSGTTIADLLDAYYSKHYSW